MESFLKSVDDRTQLAGANRLEVLLFSLGKDRITGRSEVFGINVFKVREVMHAPAITRAPDSPPGVEGLVSLRGAMVPVVNVPKFCGIELDALPKIIIVTEYNRSTQALLVHSVEHILRMNWNEMKVPPPMLAHQMGGLVTAVTELADGRIVMLLDVEKILSEASSFGKDMDEFADLEVLGRTATILYADDSTVARKQIEMTLDKLGVRHIGCRNGLDAWKRLEEIADQADLAKIPVYNLVQMVLTDVEMPEMDGYVLTKKIKSDPRFVGIPVVMHSSLSAQANIAMGRAVGADMYVPKFDPKELAAVVRPLLSEDKKAKL